MRINKKSLLYPVLIIFSPFIQKVECEILTENGIRSNFKDIFLISSKNELALNNLRAKGIKKTIVVDLAEGNKEIDNLSPDDSYGIILKNAIPNSNYEITIQEILIITIPLPKPDIRIQSFLNNNNDVIKNLSANCQKIWEIGQKLDAKNIQEKNIPEIEKSLKKELNNLETDCINAHGIEYANGLLSETKRVIDTPILTIKKGAEYILKITKKNSDKAWIIRIKSIDKSRWNRTWGMAWIWTGDSKSLMKEDLHFLKMSDSNTQVTRTGTSSQSQQDTTGTSPQSQQEDNDTIFEVTAEMNSTSAQAIPTVFYTYVGKPNSFFQPGLTGGLGLKFDSFPPTFFAASATFKDNLALHLGVAIHTVRKLKGRYKKERFLKLNIPEDDLHRNVPAINYFASVSFRFDANPFAKTSEKNEGKNQGKNIKNTTKNGESTQDSPGAPSDSE